MDPELAVRLVDALDAGLPEFETVCLHLYGGEPLTNLPAMQALIDQAHRKPPGRFRFAITTNGTLLSQETMRLLDEGQFQVVLSIDGPAEIHDTCRRTPGDEPTQARVMAFLQALRSQTGCWVRGSAVVRSGWSLRQAITYLHTLPVDTLKAQAVRAPAGAPYVLSSTERAAYLEDLEWAGMQVISDLEAGRAPMDDRFSSRVLQLLTGIERTAYCGAGRTTFGITPTGKILPCVLLDSQETFLGHVDEDPQSWRQAGLDWLAARPAGPECRDCEAFSLCGGGCPAMIAICGPGECELIRKNCEVARSIYTHFAGRPEALLPLAGIT